MTPIWLLYRYAKNLLRVSIFKLQLRYLPVSLIMIKGTQIGDQGIKIGNFAGNITIFWRDITCLNSIQRILKLFEDECS